MSQGGGRADRSAVLDELTRLLPHAFSVRDLFSQLLPALRTALGVHRVVAFLRHPMQAEGGASTLSDARRLHSVAAVGISLKVLENFGKSNSVGVTNKKPINFVATRKHSSIIVCQ